MTRCTDPWLEARGLAADTSRAGGEHLYVPGQLLLRRSSEDTAVAAEVDRELERAGASREPVTEASQDRGRGAAWAPGEAEDEALGELGIERWHLDARSDVAGVIRRVREAVPGGVDLLPNTVLSWQPYWHGGPGSVPRVTQDPAPQPPASVTGKGAGVRVAVLDTGIVGDWASNPWFDTRVTAGPGDAEALDADVDDVLDAQAGHGTFIAAVVAREAPDAAIRTLRVMSSHGLVSDVQAAAGILAVRDHDVLSLSFGGYTMDDRAPLAVQQALAHVRRESAVVAAAGNAGADRPFWPAAFKTVVAVGAHDGGDPAERACFSNFGWWVDCCALGVDVHSVFVTFDVWPAGPGKEDFAGHALWSGTSFAAPLVAGRIAAESARSGAAPRDVAHDLIRTPALPQLPDLGTLIT